MLEAMSEISESSQPDYWSQRYASGKTPWVCQGVPHALAAFLRQTNGSGRILIPGAGADPEAIRTFSEAGHEVTAIDFSPVAVEQAKKALGRLADRIILGDFFTHDFGVQPFDLVYERTFLCSLPPATWKDYAERVAQLLRPGGKLAGFFFYGSEPDPPPYPLSDQAARALFEERFELVRSESVFDSLPMFAGAEKWQEWRRRDDALPG